MIKNCLALVMLSLILWSCAKEEVDPFATVRP